MRVTPVIMQTYHRTGQDQVELVLSSVDAGGIYAFLFCVSVSILLAVNVVSFSHVEIGTRVSVSTCAALLFAFLLTPLTLTCLARLNGLCSLVGLTMRLATNSA